MGSLTVLTITVLLGGAFAAVLALVSKHSYGFAMLLGGALLLVVRALLEIGANQPIPREAFSGPMAFAGIALLLAATAYYMILRSRSKKAHKILQGQERENQQQ